MFKIIEGLPDDVLGIEASGTITHEDYIENIIPHFESMFDTYGDIKILYVLGDDFNGYELAALWDDATYGIRHWSNISHIAIVTDNQWPHALMTMFAPLFPGELKMYSKAGLEKAKEWISAESTAK
jgi:hypothetical protein